MIILLSCKIWHLAQIIQKDNKECERTLRQWGLEKQRDMKFHVIPHFTRRGLKIMRGKCYGDKETGAKLKAMMGKCDQTQTGSACCWWLPAQTGWRAVAQTGPPLHLQSKCLVHFTGISCTASPSSGLGHLKMHGCLKQKTATQWECYTTGQEESRTPLTAARPSKMVEIKSFSRILTESKLLPLPRCWGCQQWFSILWLSQ